MEAEQNNSGLVDRLRWRYSVKKFDPSRKVTGEDWQRLEEALILSPSSYGLQPWKFIVITDQALKDQLVAHAWNQRQVADCSHLVVIASKTRIEPEYIDAYLARVMEVRDIEVNDDIRNMSGRLHGFREAAEKDGLIGEWAKNQAYIALGFLLAAAASMKIDTCPMEGFVPAEFDRVLGLTEEGLTAALLCPVGYRAEDDWLSKLAKVRFSKEDLVKQI